MGSLSDFFWIIFFIIFLIPIAKRNIQEFSRLKTMRSLEQQRRSRVITLIHRQEAISLLGIPLTRYIDIEDSENILRAIRLTPDDMPIDLVLHTPGGLVLAAEQIASALRNHPATVTVMIPHYAMSGGTLLALASDHILMDKNAVLGPIDPQIGSFPAASIIRALKEKDKNKIDDKTFIFADVAEKATVQVREFVMSLVHEKIGKEKAADLAKVLTEGRWTHDFPITVDTARKLNLPVDEGLPKQVFRLMKLYPQAIQRRPSVSYIPTPYEPERRPTRKSSGNFPFND